MFIQGVTQKPILPFPALVQDLINQYLREYYWKQWKNRIDLVNFEVCPKKLEAIMFKYGIWGDLSFFDQYSELIKLISYDMAIGVIRNLKDQIEQIESWKFEDYYCTQERRRRFTQRQEKIMVFNDQLAIKCLGVVNSKTIN